MINSKQILNSWNLFPLEDDYLPEYIINHKPDNIYYIDQCPFSVGEKHSQIEMLYQEVLDGKLSEADFLSNEIKYRNIMVKLWLYNDLIVESNLIKEIKLDNLTNCINEKYHTNMYLLQEKFLNSDGKVRIDSKNDLELLIQLSMRDIIDATYYYIDYEIAIVPTFSCFFAYFNSNNEKDIVKEIVMTEGLYLRKYSTE